MARFKLTFRNKSALEQLTLAEQTLAGIAAKPEHQQDPLQLTDAQATVAALRTSHERVLSLRAELKMEVTRRNALLRESRKKVYNTSLGVQAKTSGEPVKMGEAGLGTEAPKTVKVGKPSAPTNLRAEPTATEGEVRLRYVLPLRRCWFNIEARPDTKPEGWRLIDSSFRQSALLEGLQSGVKYWFRVSASNSHGTSPWSNLAVARAK